MAEGVQDIAYGQFGVNKKSTNVMRDGLFKGNTKKYEASKAIAGTITEIGAAGFAAIDSVNPYRNSYESNKKTNVDVDGLDNKEAGNAIPTKPNGGMDADDFISSHAQKHLYDQSKISTPNKSQYGKDVDVGKLVSDTMKNPDNAYSNYPSSYNPNPNRITKYMKEYNGNISTPDTPTSSHRVFINLDDPSRSTNFPYVPRK